MTLVFWGKYDGICSITSIIWIKYTPWLSLAMVVEHFQTLSRHLSVHVFVFHAKICYLLDFCDHHHFYEHNVHTVDTSWSSLFYFHSSLAVQCEHKNLFTHKLMVCSLLVLTTPFYTAVLASFWVTTHRASLLVQCMWMDVETEACIQCIVFLHEHV